MAYGDKGKQNGKEAAHPIPETVHKGLTKREMLAAMAMQGLLSNERISTTSHEAVAEHAVKMADALLVHLALSN